MQNEKNDFDLNDIAQFSKDLEVDLSLLFETLNFLGRVNEPKLEDCIRMAKYRPSILSVEEMVQKLVEHGLLTFEKFFEAFGHNPDRVSPSNIYVTTDGWYQDPFSGELLNEEDFLDRVENVYTLTAKYMKPFGIDHECSSDMG